MKHEMHEGETRKMDEKGRRMMKMNADADMCGSYEHATAEMESMKGTGGKPRK